jgi:hypothetical protein
MTDNAEQEWITTNEAACLLQLSVSYALPVLIQTDVGRQFVHSRLSKWNRTDVLALAALRRSGDTLTRSTERRPRRSTQQRAEVIREYWSARGYEVGVEVVRMSYGPTIVSDMVDGYPFDWSGSK